jgi:hypothetical protein
MSEIFPPTRCDGPGRPGAAEIDEWVKSGRGAEKETMAPDGPQD